MSGLDEEQHCGRTAAAAAAMQQDSLTAASQHDDGGGGGGSSGSGASCCLSRASLGWYTDTQHMARMVDAEELQQDGRSKDAEVERQQSVVARYTGAPSLRANAE